jgi:hypothetical protein
MSVLMLLLLKNCVHCDHIVMFKLLIPPFFFQAQNLKLCEVSEAVTQRVKKLKFQKDSTITAIVCKYNVLTSHGLVNIT